MERYSYATDQELLKLLRINDIKAYTEIHNRYYSILYIHAFQRLNNRDEVKDILQELFLHLWKHRHQNDFQNLSAYLYKAVRNRILNNLRHSKVKSEYAINFRQFSQSATIISDEQLLEKELIGLVEAAVTELPPQMQQVFRLSRQQMLSHDEIAKTLEISPATVKRQISNSIKILRAKLSSYFSSVLFF